MLKKKRQRDKGSQSKATTFKLYGEPVPEQKIARWETRMLMQGKITENETFSEICGHHLILCCQSVFLLTARRYAAWPDFSNTNPTYYRLFAHIRGFSPPQLAYKVVDTPLCVYALYTVTRIYCVSV